MIEEKCKRCDHKLTCFEGQVFPCERCDQGIDLYAERTGADAAALKRMLRCNENPVVNLVRKAVGI
ncbi:MAG: hypothetical protein ACTSPB_04750 [Candidatus Thorarchaeota archaeon]